MRPLNERETEEIVVAYKQLLFQVACLSRAGQDCKMFRYAENYKRRYNEVYKNTMDMTAQQIKRMKELGLIK